MKDLIVFWGILWTITIFGRTIALNATQPNATYIVTTIEETPYVDKKYHRFEGLIVDILDRMEEILNVNFQLNLVKDGRYGYQLPDKSWNGMIGEVQRGEADLIVAPLTHTSRRAAHIDYSIPFMQTGYRILVSREKLAARLNINIFHMLMTPLRPELWVVTLVLCAGVATLLCLIAKYSPWERAEVGDTLLTLGSSGITLPNSINFGLSALTWQGYSFPSRSVSSRVLVCAWWIFAVFFLLVYSSNLTAFLLSKAPGLMTLPFLTFDEMASQTEIDYATLPVGSTRRYFQNSKLAVEQKVWKGMWNKVDYFPISIAEGVRRARNEKFAFIAEAASLEYLASRQPCDLTVIGETRSQITYGFACRKGSGLCKLVDTALLKMQEDATLDTLKNKWFIGECVASGSEEFTSYGQQIEAASSGLYGLQGETPVTVEKFLVPILLLVVGIVTSILALVGEIVWVKRYGDPAITVAEDRHHFAADSQQLS